MQALLERERSIQGRSDLAVNRSQIVVSLNQGEIATNELHNEVTSSQTEIDGVLQSIGTDAARLEPGCQAVAGGDQADPGVQALSSACSRLHVSEQGFSTSVTATKSRFAQAEEDYQAAQKNQQRILFAATSLE